VGHDRALVERSPSRWPWLLLAAVVVVGAGSTMLRAGGGGDPSPPDRPPPDLPSDVVSAGDAEWITPVDGLASAAPAVVGGVVVVVDEDGGLHGIERGTGARLWRTPAAGPAAIPPVAIGQHVVSGRRNRLAAFRGVNGAAAWEIELPAALVGPPAVVGSRLVAVTRDGAVHSVDGQRAEIRWEVATGVPAAGEPAADTRIVAVPGGDGRVRGLRVESGAVAYSGRVGDLVGLAVSRGLVYATTADGDVVATTAASAGASRSPGAPPAARWWSATPSS
jgi:outer membrane protein assembly factor BamB